MYRDCALSFIATTTIRLCVGKRAREMFTVPSSENALLFPLLLADFDRFDKYYLQSMSCCLLEWCFHFYGDTLIWIKSISQQWTIA